MRLIAMLAMLSAIPLGGCFASGGTVAYANPIDDGGCVEPNEQVVTPAGATTELSFAKARLSAHVADSPSEREQGLMHVNTMEINEGMVFAYPEPSARFFWMKNTPLPLDIAFVNAEERIVKIAQMEPNSTVLTPSGAPVTWVVEAHAGWFAQHGVRVGDVVVGLPPRPKE